mgnify:CR=1 FL=1
MRHDSLCTALDERGKECFRPAFESSPITLCRLHLVLAAQFVAEMGGLGATAVLTQQADPEPPKRPTSPHGRHMPDRIPHAVYYMRLSNRIKIGTTSNLPNRLKGVHHDELLAIEPGGYALEAQRHGEFRDLRLPGGRNGREWFDARPVLLAHVARVREEHGDPMEAWENIATRGR